MPTCTCHPIGQLTGRSCTLHPIGPNGVGDDPVGRTNIFQATWGRSADSIGDFNLDEHKDVTDIELLGDAMAQDYELKYRQYDLNESGAVDARRSFGYDRERAWYLVR